MEVQVDKTKPLKQSYFYLRECRHCSKLEVLCSHCNNCQLCRLYITVMLPVGSSECSWVFSEEDRTRLLPKISFMFPPFPSVAERLSDISAWLIRREKLKTDWKSKHSKSI